MNARGQSMDAENFGLRLKHSQGPRPRAFGTDLTNVPIKQESPDTKPGLFLAEYANEIYSHLHEIETTYLPRYGYMSFQDSINEKMRSILIDWIIEVHHKFKLAEETLFLSVNIIDRYLEKVQVSKEELQLIGVSSLLIACKYEEIYAPEIKDFVSITDNAYLASQIIETENKVLRTLSFNLTVPSAFRFLQRYTKVCEFDDYAFTLSRYIIELSLVEYKLLKYKPSNIAAAAMYLTQKVLKTCCCRSLNEQTPLTDADIRTCAKDLTTLWQRAEAFTLQAVRKKFLHSKFYEVAKIQVKF